MSSSPAEPLRMLGAFLNGTEADGIAARLVAGSTLSQALVVVPAARRVRVRELFEAAGLGPRTCERSVAVLTAIAGAASRVKDVELVWTAPAGLLGSGALTGDVFGMVGSAVTSVVCATYNLQPTSALWKALTVLVRERPGVAVRLYVDTQAADGRFVRPGGWSVRRHGGVAGPRAGSRDAPTLSTDEMARLLTGAVVLRTRAPGEGERAVTSHAKFLSIDHRFLLVGSANFSYSAEERNVELGLRLDDPALAHSVEKQMRDLEAGIYERVMEQR
ncbi:phospholipase D-like domain-containing protein [Actinomyces bowdenii]|uniref:phospholipase D-like domain-containing protein n=1 Tax=Actinomyces bowdenii TaxID=131109 RepID=UPI00214B9DE5|nr:phospholipase D-like domain-containing protein [Actinomyces bowdenii]MCR2053092.1 phospholipase D-like domain-containing protein [Actinomyces bowdenii]